MPSWSCSSGLLQGCVTPRGPQKYEGSGQFDFGGVLWHSFHIGHGTSEGGNDLWFLLGFNQCDWKPLVGLGRANTCDS